jgi:hypothetical protein
VHSIIIVVPDAAEKKKVGKHVGQISIYTL